MNDELQPLWVAIVLWKDVQIRLTVIRPTIPVMAFEAPGSLGCEKPVSVCRRSDPMAGWEYAEAEGRAIAIQRLLGFDCQRVSAPFLDQSNLNLGYTYAEQPIVYESQASVAPRCLAAASLLRPAPFEPGYEFSGIEVKLAYPETFQITLPDSRMALVAPGETTPKQIRIQGIDLEGTGMRYAQMTSDFSEICGLGVTSIAGIASFSSPATFRLQRAFVDGIRVTTDTGISLTESWLRGPVHCVEALTPERTWVDVTSQCPNGSIPPQVVQEWSDRNQRTLVDFRINA